MIIGVDFDNTIICYDHVFRSAALSLGLIPKNILILQNKQSIKQYLIAEDRESEWTFLQGIVYGVWIEKARAFPFVVETIQSLLKSGHMICVISHKTRYPYSGPQNDLHLSANKWLEQNVICKLNKSLAVNFSVSFNETVDQKIENVRSGKCDVFIDDLEQILLHKDFPAQTKRILFSPLEQSPNVHNQTLSVMSSWSEFENLIDE